MPAASSRAPGQAFDFLESRSSTPPERMVSRTALVNRLRATAGNSSRGDRAGGVWQDDSACPVGRARLSEFAWVTIDARDNDPVVLLRHITAALERAAPVQKRLVAALRSPSESVWTPRCRGSRPNSPPGRRSCSSTTTSHLLRSRASLDIVAALGSDEAEGSLLVLASRVSPRLPLASLRARGRLVELGATDLAMTKREWSCCSVRPVSPSRPDASRLVTQCEGWPAALYLAALSIRDGGGAESARLTGDDRYLADYFRSEYLAHLRPGPLRFLRRTAVLDRLCGSLCDAVLDDEGSGQELEKIERANLFLVPLDHQRNWFRYHHLFRDLLQRELLEREPELLPVLHTRAANWSRRTAKPSALEHAWAASATDRAAAILASVVFDVYYSGRVATSSSGSAASAAPSCSRAIR